MVFFLLPLSENIIKPAVRLKKIYKYIEYIIFFPVALIFVIGLAIYEVLMSMWEKWHLYFTDKKEYNRKYHPEPEVPWPTDPVERSKCPRVKLEYDNGFEFTASGRQGFRELIYVENNYDAKLNSLFLENKKLLDDWAKEFGYTVTYLPSLVNEIFRKEVVSYRMPFYKGPINVPTIDSGYIFQFLAHPEDRERMAHGLLWAGGGGYKIYHKTEVYEKRYFPLSLESDKSLQEQLAEIRSVIFEHDHSAFLGMTVKDSSGGKEEDTADDNFNSQCWGENTDDLIQEVREKIALLRQRGVAEHILESLLTKKYTISGLVITKDYRIILPHYDNMEIKMEPLAKAVYLLFLNHPKGILFKNLPDYRKELMKIYARLRPNGLTEKAKQSIIDVTNPLSNSINEKCARIRGAFVSQMDNELARFYYIDGQRAKPKSIKLERKCVEYL